MLDYTKRLKNKLCSSVALVYMPAFLSRLNTFLLLAAPIFDEGQNRAAVKRDLATARPVCQNGKCLISNSKALCCNGFPIVDNEYIFQVEYMHNSTIYWKHYPFLFM